MKWETLDLHLENLLPGLITLPLLLSIVPVNVQNRFRAPSAMNLLGSDAIRVGVFLATAYVIGVIAVVVSRLAIDWFSSLWPRPLMLRLSRNALTGTKDEVNAKYRKALGDVLSCGLDQKIKEVLKRRERGRLIRTSLIPLILAAWIASADHSLVVRLLLEGFVFVAILLLYAYVEVTIYHEATIPTKPTEASQSKRG
jgi:hypothetical protein